MPVQGGARLGVNKEERDAEAVLGPDEFVAISLHGTSLRLMIRICVSLATV
jgi:hypothetical protein